MWVMNDLVIEREVPILDEHRLTDANGETVTELDMSKLARIARNNNRRIEETGDEVPIVIGHTFDDAPEEDQPEIVGYASEFSVGDLFDTGRKALKATFKFFADKIDKVRRFPRRSVELWLDRLEVDPISLLGATAPERSLGLLRLDRSSGPSVRLLYKLQREGTMADTDQKETPPTGSSDGTAKEVMSMIMETDVWKKLEAIAKMADDPLDDDPLDDPLDEEPLEDDLGIDDPLPPVEEELDEVPLDDEDEDPDKKENRVGKKRNYEAAAPSGSNTCVPGGTRKRLSREDRDLRLRLSRQESIIQRQQQELDKVLLKYRRAERTNALIGVQNEGVDLGDLEEEVEAAMPLTDQEFEARLTQIRKKYRRVETGTPSYMNHTRMPTEPSLGGNGGSGTSAEMRDKAVDMALAQNITYEEAVARLGGERVT